MPKTLTKRELAKQLAAEGRFLWMTQSAAVDIIETITDLIALHIQGGGQSVTMRGFGSFKVQKTRARIVKHPVNGYQIKVPERTTIGFKPSAEVIRRLNP